MSFEFLHLIILGTIAAAANVVGGLVLIPGKVQEHIKTHLKYFLALGGGFMLAVIFFELLPRSIDLWHAPGDMHEWIIKPMMLMLIGYLLTQVFEHTVAPHFHLGEEVSPNSLIAPASAYAAISGLIMHTFFDGVSIAAAYQIDAKAGLLVFAAVTMHKLPEGFTIGSLMLAAGKPIKTVILATSAVGLTTFAGLILFHFVGTYAESAVLYALPISCGVTLYVAASDLIPQVNHHGGRRPLVTLFVLAGIGIFYLMYTLMHSTAAH